MGPVSAPVSGLLPLNKSPGLTSFEALFPVKKALGSGKAGHTGTLDKFASGLLLVLTGRALKLSPWFSRCNKEYEGVIRFGVETDTLDPEGAVVAEAPVPSREAVEAALPRFTGEIVQAPPAYSAIHLDGRRAHELARAGEEVEMKKRPVTIHRLELLSWEPPLARILVRCSSGTYIRSLARDLALAAGSRARLSALTRTRAAGFSLDDALEAGDGAALRAGILPIDRGVIAKLGLPRFDLGPEMLEKIIHGKPISHVLDTIKPVPAGDGTAKNKDEGALFADGSGFPEAAALFCGDVFAGIAVRKAGTWGYGCVYAAEGERP